MDFDHYIQKDVIKKETKRDKTKNKKKITEVEKSAFLNLQATPKKAKRENSNSKKMKKENRD